MASKDTDEITVSEDQNDPSKSADSSKEEPKKEEPKKADTKKDDKKSKGNKKSVIIDTLDGPHEFTISSSTTGRQLFDMVVKELKIQEVWFFGLLFIDSKANPTWLKLKKKVYSQDVGKKRPVHLKLMVKFYPENVERELVYDGARRHVFLQVKEDILSRDIYCPPDTAVLLASYQVQEELGQYDLDKHKPGFLKDMRVLPEKMLDEFNLSWQQWEDRLVSFYRDHKTMTKETATKEYLKVAQDLEMFGINYYEIKNKKGTALFLGVDAKGLFIYEKDDKITPKISFPWSEIRSIAFNEKKFIIKPVDFQCPNFIFYVSRVKVNKVILTLCMGNHELYVRRRKLERGNMAAVSPEPPAVETPVESTQSEQVESYKPDGDGSTKAEDKQNGENISNTTVSVVVSDEDGPPPAIPPKTEDYQDMDDMPTSPTTPGDSNEPFTYHAENEENSDLHIDATESPYDDVRGSSGQNGHFAEADYNGNQSLNDDDANSEDRPESFSQDYDRNSSLDDHYDPPLSPEPENSSLVCRSSWQEDPDVGMDKDTYMKLRTLFDDLSKAKKTPKDKPRAGESKHKTLKLIQRGQTRDRISIFEKM